jgi:hypothetical protein
MNGRNDVINGNSKPALLIFRFSSLPVSCRQAF